MKKFVGLLCALSLFALVISGCTTIKASQYSGPLNVNVTADLKADVEVGEKISGTAISTRFLIFPLEFPNKFAEGVSYGIPIFVNPFNPEQVLWEQLKAAAAYDAVNKSGADVLIAPKYEIQTDESFLFRTVTVIVTGYKGKIKSIK